MTESGFKKAQAYAEAKVQPILSKLHDILIDVYMSGFVAGMEASEPSDKELESKLAEEEEVLLHLKKDAILQKRLKQTDFSVRTWNILRPNDINTLGDIVSRSRLELISMKGFGKVCLTEVEAFVKRFGYELQKS